VQLDSKLVEQLRSGLPELPRQVRERLEGEGVPTSCSGIIASDSRRLSYFGELVEMRMPVAEAANLVVNRPEALDRPSAEVFGALKKAKKEVVTDTQKLTEIAEGVIAENQQPVADFRGGKEGALQFLLGQVMKETQGKADPEVAAKLLRELLAN